MATSVSSVVSHFPEAENGFTTTTAGSVSSGATTVTLNSVAGYTNGEPVVLVIDPTDASKKQTFTGIVDTGGVQITSVVWTAGTNQTHALGATVVDYATATHISMISKGIKVHADQDGTLKAGAVDVTAVIADGVITKAKLATAEKSALDSGWSPKYGDTTMPAPNTVTCNGNRSYDVVFNSVDLTGYLSAGMRIRTTRTVAAPTQCTDLERGSSQYYSRASASVGAITFADDFVVSAWIKLESYNSDSAIISRYNGTSGFIFMLNSSGQVVLNGYNGGAANVSGVTSYQSVPLNKWVHVAAQLDMSAFTATTTTSYVMIDGKDVPASVARGGTNPTTLTQAGDLNIGAYNNAASTYFDGKIAQAALYSAKVTQANVLATISQGLSGSETSLLCAYSFNGVVTDLSSNAYTLTAQNSAAATATDSPFGSQADGTISSTLDYAIIDAASFSTNTTLTVRVPEGNTIPTTGGVSAVAYSTQASPYGCPQISNILSQPQFRTNFAATTIAQVSGATATVYIPAGREIQIVFVAEGLYCSTAAFAIPKFWDGVVSSGTELYRSEQYHAAAGTTRGLTMESPILKPTTGSHTFNVSLEATSGTATLNGSSTAVYSLIVKLV